MISTRDCLEKLHDYVPGKSIEEVAAKHNLSKVIKLASNENPLGCSPKAKEAIKETADKVHLYPIGHSPKLLEAVSADLGVQKDQLFFTNGSDEAIWLLATAYLNPEEEVLSSVETFSEYEFCTYLLDGQYRNVPLKNGEFDLDAIAEAVIPGKTRMIFICAPNNPTGTAVKSKDFDEFFKKIPRDVLVMVDQAYVEFVTDPEYPQLLKRLAREPNLVLLRTFSKIFGLAGLRMGYAIANPQVIKPLYKVKQPFNVNLIAQAAALAAWQDKSFVQATLANNQLGKSRLEKLFKELSLNYYETQANFICFELGDDAAEFCAFTESRGLILRWLKSFKLPRYIRVTIGLPHELQLFEELLKEWISARN